MHQTCKSKIFSSLSEALSEVQSASRARMIVAEPASGRNPMQYNHSSVPSKSDRNGGPEFLAPSPAMDRSENFISLGTTMLDALERVGFGAILLYERECVLSINATAQNLLRQKFGRGSGQSDADWLQNVMRRIPECATPWFPSDTETWRTLPCDGERPIALHRIPLFHSKGRGEYFVLILADFGGGPQPNPDTLRRIFGLTGAEARLAIRIAHGETPTAIARDQGVSVATVRCQLASIFAKTQTRRQTELAMLLMRVAILP